MNFALCVLWQLARIFVYDPPILVASVLCTTAPTTGSTALRKASPHLSCPYASPDALRPRRRRYRRRRCFVAASAFATRQRLRAHSMRARQRHRAVPAGHNLHRRALPSALPDQLLPTRLQLLRRPLHQHAGRPESLRRLQRPVPVRRRLQFRRLHDCRDAGTCLSPRLRMSSVELTKRQRRESVGNRDRPTAA